LAQSPAGSARSAHGEKGKRCNQGKTRI